jgi:Uma2 family endonuclease
MSTIAGDQPTVTAHAIPLSVSRDFYRFTVAQFDQMLKDGTIGADEQVELIDGHVMTKMPKNPPHIMVGKLLDRIFWRLLDGTGWHPSKDADVTVTEYDRPQPDLAVVRGDPEDYRDRHATAADIGLAIEISDSTLIRDRSIKMPRYAAAKIPVYWIVNLIDEQFEVYTNPALTPTGASYMSSMIFRRGENVPVVIGGKQIGEVAVSDILTATVVEREDQHPPSAE